MMNRRLLVLFFAALVLSSCAHATQVRFDEFLSSTADVIYGFLSDVSQRLMFTGMIWNKINAIKYEVYDNLPDYLLRDPNVSDAGLRGITGYFARILQPVFVLSIIVTGAYLMFYSGGPESRSKAKDMLLGLLLGVGAISLSPQIIALLLEVSNALTANILGLGPFDAGFTYRKAIDYLSYRSVDIMWSNVLLGLPFMLLSFLFVAGLVAVLAARYVLIIALSAFFPVAIFFFLFKPTRSIGRVVFKNLFFWVFLPPAYALVLVVVSLSSQNLTYVMPNLSDVICLTGTFVLVSSPVMMFFLVEWGASVASSVAMLFGPAPTPAEGAEPGKKKSSLEAAAVGFSGYSKKKEVKKEVKEEVHAIGMRGYSSKDKKKRSVKEKKPVEKETPYTTAYRPRSVVGDAFTGYKGDKSRLEKADEKTFAERFYDEQLRTPVEKAKNAGLSVPFLTPLKKVLSPESTKRPILVVSIPPSSIPQLSLKIEKGESEMVSLILRNDGNVKFYKIALYEDDLAGDGLELAFSDNYFPLKPGESKLVKLKVTVDEEPKFSVYKGTIVLRPDSGNQINIETDVEPIERRKDEEKKEDDEKKEDRTGDKKKEEKKESTNIFGEKVTVEAGKKEEAPKEKKVTALSNYASRRVIHERSARPIEEEETGEKKVALLSASSPRGSFASPSIMVERGGSASETLVVRNDGNVVFSRVTLSEESLAKDGLSVGYSERGFGLEVGESRLVRVEFSAAEDAKPGLRTGSVVVKGERGASLLIETRVEVLEKKAGAGGGEKAGGKKGKGGKKSGGASRDGGDSEKAPQQAIIPGGEEDYADDEEEEDPVARLSARCMDGLMYSPPMKIEKGGEKTVTLIIKNEGGADYADVFISDIDLKKQGLVVVYEKNHFPLKAGESELVNIKFGVDARARRELYEGSIIAAGEAGEAVVLDVKIEAVDSPHVEEKISESCGDVDKASEKK